MAKKTGGRRHSAEFKAAALEKMKGCDSVVALARELNIHWRLLYRWKAAAAKASALQHRDAAARREAELQAEIAKLKSALADKTLEVDFFRGALQKIEALRPQRNASGGEASTTRSGKGCGCKAS